MSSRKVAEPFPNSVSARESLRCGWAGCRPARVLIGLDGVICTGHDRVIRDSRLDEQWSAHVHQAKEALVETADFG